MNRSGLSECVLRFTQRLQKEDVNMHGFLLSVRGKKIAEAYYAPFREGQPHRLYSVSKTFTGIAVGMLADSGSLTLDQHITDFFQDWLPDNPSPYLLHLTISDMLRMSTCYRRTAYREGIDSDWARSFFTGSPDHEPGMVFAYDTGCSQVLAALVRRISGMEVMDYLEEHDIGFDTGVAKVPLVVQSDIYDLTVGAADVRPDSQMGYEAAKAAFENPNYKDGNYGAGCGASVGKITGMERAMTTGVGSYAVQVGDLQIGAIVIVNALGDIYDWKTGNQIAGLLSEDKTKLASTMESMSASIEAVDNKFTGNTTIAVIITNANFNKSQLCKIAGMGHDGYARSINPVHTSADGDSIYAVSVGDVSADQDLVGSLGAEVLSEAIIRAVTSADSAYGLPSAVELGFVEKVIHRT